MNLKAILHTVLFTFLGGVVGAAEQWIQTGNSLPQTSVQWHQFVAVVCTAGVTAALALWKSPPTSQPPKPPSSVATGKQVAGLAILLALGIGMIGLTGCKAVSTTPAGAPTITALNVLNEVQQDVLAVQNAEISAVKSGLIDHATDLQFQAAFKQEALDATALADAISTTAGAPTVQAKVTVLLNDIQVDVGNGVAGIKDANTKAVLTTAVSAAEIAVNTIMAAYNAGN